MKVHVSKYAVVLLLFLNMQRSKLTVSSTQAGLESLSIKRGEWESDIFTFYFANGFKCIKQHDGSVTNWCTSLNAGHQSNSNDRTICSCRCLFGSRTFLPQKQICVNATGAASCGGKLIKEVMSCNLTANF